MTVGWRMFACGEDTRDNGDVSCVDDDGDIGSYLTAML